MGRQIAVVFSVLLVACTPLGERPAPTPLAVESPVPAAEYAELGRQGERVLRLDSARSLVVVEVRRAGALADLGHDHVVASRAVQGYVAPDLGRADVALRLESLEVDEPGLRAEAGMESQPSDADIRGTRGNMLGPVLEADRYPFAVIAIRGVPLHGGESRVPVLLTLHGVTQAVDVPVRVDVRDGSVTVTGRFAIKQTSFRIVPFALLGGAIAVQDRIDIRFQLLAS